MVEKERQENKKGYFKDFCARFFVATENYIKMMKNNFYFILKALFFLKILKFLSLIFCHVRKRLDKTAKLVLKFMSSQTDREIIAIQR